MQKIMKYCAAKKLMVTIALVVSANVCQASEPDLLELAIHPVMSEQSTLERYQPVADYLSSKTGKQVVIRTSPNFFSYWQRIRQPNSYALILDSAHFTDYRSKKLGYKVLAKVPDLVSYSLVVRKNNNPVALNDLIGKRVATLGAPSLAATRLSAIFANPARLPVTVNVSTPAEGIKVLTEKKNVLAAFLPTAYVIKHLQTHDDLKAIIMTEPMPPAAISASPQVDPAVLKTIQDALLEAKETPDGRVMLQKVGLAAFSPASSELYAGYSHALQQYWGY